jgi:two-component system, chemotaxis family, protein-glutamate methylesterase/glutaminase
VIRVLVVEDSATTRALLVAILKGDSQIQVVGEAKDGVEAVAMTEDLRPDLVTMDVQMPRLNGLEATKEIMITAPTPIIIVTDHARTRQVETSLSALRVGALEVLEKPPSPGSTGFEAAAKALIAAVKAMSQVKVVRHWRHFPAPALPNVVPVPMPPDASPGVRGRVVAIATSTGGPAALQLLLSELPGEFSVPILIVQHITPGFTAGLASWLNHSCSLHVKIAESGERLLGHTVYIAPDTRHLGVLKDVAILSDAPPISGFRPSATHLFESVAKTYGASAIGVILTGMGDDGVRGLRAIRQIGGRVIAQDEPTSVVFGMPRAAISAGLPQFVLPIHAIAPQLLALV